MTQESTIHLYTYNDTLEANIVRDKLKAQGIDSFIENEASMGSHPVSGIKVMIFSKDKEAAEKIINE